MPAATISLAPQIAEPVQISSTSLSGLATSSNCTLQAVPSQSTSCHDAFALGEVFRFSSKEGRKRSKNLATYVTSASGIVLMDSNSQTIYSSSPFSSSLRPITPPLVLQEERYLLTFLALHPRTVDDSAELHVWLEQSQGISSAPLVKNVKCQISADIISLHPLTKSEILARHKDGRFSIIGFNSFTDVKLTVTTPSIGANSAGRNTLFVDVFDQTEIVNFTENATTRSSAKALIVSITSANESEKVSERPKRKGRKSAAESDGLEETANNKVLVEFFTIESGDVLPERRIRKLGETELSFIEGKSVVSMSLRPSGALSMILDDGRLLSTVLQSKEDGQPTHGEVSIVSIPNAAGSISSAVLSTSAFTALVGFSTTPSSSRTQLHLLLINTELGCVLAEQTWKAPEDCGHIFIKPLNMTKASSALVLSTPKSLNQAKPQTYLWSTSFQLGEGGNLRWALTSRQLTKKWINFDRIDGYSENPAMKLVQILRTISSSDKDAVAKSKEMEKSFDKWIKENSATANSFSQAVVSDILTIVLPLSSAMTETNAKSDRAYPRRIVHYLLEQRLVRSLSFTPNAFLTGMATVGDWEGVLKALHSVDDLSEEDIVMTIHIASRLEMEDREKLQQILCSVAQLQLSSAELRKAMKSRLDERSVESVLQSVSEWLKPSKEDALLENDISVNGQIEKPTVSQALKFAIEVLDTFFPLMLTTPSFQSPLEQLSSSIEGHLSTVDSLTLLRGPLAAFAKLNDDRQREIETETSQLAREMAELQGFEGGMDDLEALKRAEKFSSGLYKSKGPDSSRGKQAKSISQANIAQQIGAGALSRSGQRPLTRGQQSVVNNVAVGLYALEQFEL